MASNATTTPAAKAAVEPIVVNYKHTCLNCCVRFADASMWRDHYRTDWHRYNLKRSVAELPPVTAEEFQRRIIQQRELAAGPVKNAHYCKQCRKQFGSTKSHDNHLNSKAHRENVERFEVEQAVTTEVAEQEAELDRLTEQHEAVVQEKRHRPAIDPEDEAGVIEDLDSDDLADDDDDDDDIEEVDSDEWDEDEDDDAEDNSYDNPIVQNRCIFCGQRSASLVENMKHMSTVHSFFVPDTEYVVNLPGLMRYLGEKVARDFICLWCNDRGRTFFTLDAARKHMRDKGHCKMLHEGLALAEYAKYYDYSASYPDNVS